MDIKILSLLPSATEICYLLGLEDNLLGVTHECNWPVQVNSKPKVTKSIIPSGSTPLEIDDIIRQAAKTGQLTQEIDLEKIREIQPDIILTQDICKVCAVPKGHLSLALEVLDLDTEIVSLDPFSLEDVFQNILTVGLATATHDKALAIVDSLRSSIKGLEPPGRMQKIFPLEWANPPYSAGHWVPEMIETAGAEPVGCVKNGSSTRLSWDEVTNFEFDSVLFMPCGFGIEQALAQAEEIIDLPALSKAKEFYVANAGGYFSRPGPRLIDGILALHAIMKIGRGDDSILRRIK